MARGKINKVLMLGHLYKIKTDIHDGHYGDKSPEWKDGAQYALNKFLDKLNEYSE